MTISLGVMRAPETILFGAGQRFAVGDCAAQFGSTTLICTDERFAASEHMQDILDALKKSNVEATVYAETQPELPTDIVMDCVAKYADLSPDSIIGVGGGSCLDMAKFVSLVMAHGGELSDYYGEFNVPGPVTPVIAMPTTSGTGSEVTPVAVVADNKRDLKVGVSSPYLIPRVAICDPDFTMTCPPGLTAVAGADAMTHAIEALTAIAHPATSDISSQRVFVGQNILSSHNAINAITEISASLAEAVEDGSNVEARTRLMLGALLAGLAFGAAGTSAAHAIQYPVGAITKTSHGLGVATLMPYAMEYNITERQSEYASVAQAMGAQGDDETELAIEAVRRVRALFAKIGIPNTLEELGLSADKKDWVADQSMGAGRLIGNNPRVLDLAGVTEIVQAAFVGKAVKGSV